MKKDDLNKFHQFKGKWECITCKHDKFPFSFIDNSHLDDLTCNSNIKCRCNVRFPHIKVDDKLKLLLTQSNENNSWKSHHLDIEEEFEENIEIKPNFKYYNIHDFHILGKTLVKQSKLMLRSH